MLPTFKPQVIVFDLDGTLAKSKSALDDEMVEIFQKLLLFYPVAIISGGNFKQFQDNVLNQLDSKAKGNINLANLHLLPTSGTQYYRYVSNGSKNSNDKWQLIYQHEIPLEDRIEIIETVEKSAKELNLWEKKTYGDIIEDRKSQITFSALGQLAPVEEKEKWDPDNSRKELLRDKIAQVITKYQVASGGSTSIDITIKGIDKAYGVSELVMRNNFDIEKVLFIGDRLEPGGNDEPVKKLNLQTLAVRDPEDTKMFLQGLLLEK